MVFDGNTERKMEHTIWNSIKNWAENWFQIVCGILFYLIIFMTNSESQLFNNTEDQGQNLVVVSVIKYW